MPDNDIQNEPVATATALARHIRVAPRKVKIALDLIRNQPTDRAEAILKHTPKAACAPILKLLKSAVANAENNKNMDASRLYVSKCCAGAGPTLKRMRPRARGRSFRINKRTSHISLELREKE